MRNKLFILMSLVLSLNLSACGNQAANDKDNTKSENKVEQTSSQDDKDAKKEDDKSDSSDSQPSEIVLKHAFGETKIEKRPQRIATIGWGNQDVPLSLGIVPVGFSKLNYGVEKGKEILPWTEKQIKDLNESPEIFDDLDGLNFEAISNAKPDVILAGYSGITEDDYKTLSKIAPVATYPDKPWQTLWRDMVKIDSKAMGMEREGEELIGETEKLINENVEKHPEIKGKKAVFIMLNQADPSKFWIFTSKDPRVAYLLDLGLEFPSSLKEFEKDGSFTAELSSEEANKIDDADILITYGDDTTLKTLQDDPLFGKLKAVKNGAVAVIPDNTPLAASCIPTPLSIAYTINDYLDLISNACKNAK